MDRKFIIIETFFNERKQNFYYLMLPGVAENGFYRATMSFNAFFNSTRKPKANRTSVRQFTANYEEDIKDRGPFNIEYAFNSIWDFYDFIGYDYKARKYKSGEIMFDGKEHVEQFSDFEKLSELQRINSSDYII